MSIASEIQRLSGIRSDIFDSITNKGVTVPESATFSSCPYLIDSIQTGGGGGNNALYNTGAVAIAKASAFRTGQIMQYEMPSYRTATLTPISARYNATTRGILIWNVPISSLSAISSTGTYELGVIPTATTTGYLSAIAKRSYTTGVGSTAGWYMIQRYSYDVISPQTFYWSSVSPLNTPNAGDYIQIGWMASGNQILQKTAVPALYNGQLSGTVTGIEITGYEYPYPDRPIYETATISAYASAAEYITEKADGLPSINVSGIAYTGITGNGTRSNVTGNIVVGTAVEYAKAAASGSGLNGWGDVVFPTVNYPRTAYFTSYNTSPTYTTAINNYV